MALLPRGPGPSSMSEGPYLDECVRSCHESPSCSSIPAFSRTLEQSRCPSDSFPLLYPPKEIKRHLPLENAEARSDRVGMRALGEVGPTTSLHRLQSQVQASPGSWGRAKGSLPRTAVPCSLPGGTDVSVPGGCIRKPGAHP